MHSVGELAVLRWITHFMHQLFWYSIVSLSV